MAKSLHCSPETTTTLLIGYESESVSHAVMSDSLQPMDCSPPGSSVHGILQARILEGLPFPPPRDLPHPGIEPVFLMSPALEGRLLTTSTSWEALYPNTK